MCHWVWRSSCVHLIAVALFHRMAWQRLWEVPMIHNLSLAPSWLLHFFVCFFFIFILPFSAIFQVMASQQPNLKFFLLRHLGFCTFLTFVYLNIFSPYCVIFQKMAWQRKSPMIYNLSLSANFSSPNQFCFLRIVFFKNNMYFQIRILTDMQKKVLSAIFFTKIHFHAEMSFNVSQLIHMNGSCAICRQSTFSRGVLMFCSWFMMLNDWHCLWTTLGWTHLRINIQQGGLLVITNVILTSHSQDLNTLLTTWGPPKSWKIKLKLSPALYIDAK